MTAQTITTTPTITSQRAIAALQAVRTELRSVIVEREDEIDVALCAILSRQHVVMYGGPGLGKSMLVGEVCKRITDSGTGGLRFWKMLATKSTKEDQIFGPQSISAFKNDRYQRVLTGRLADTEIAFVDEMFKLNDAGLNAMLGAINEREYDDGSVTIRIPLITMFAASNELPTDDNLRAFYDRLALRVEFDEPSDSAFEEILRRGDGAIPAPTAFMSRDDLLVLQAAVRSIARTPVVLSNMRKLRTDLASKGVTASPRRWNWLLTAVAAKALLEGRDVIVDDDYAILEFGLWDTREQRVIINRALAGLQSPLVEKALKLRDKAHSAYTECMKKQNATPAGDESALVDANGVLKATIRELHNLLVEAKAEGRGVSKVEEQLTRVIHQQKTIAELIMGA